MDNLVVLVHSPLVGPETWSPVAGVLRVDGVDVLVPALRRFGLVQAEKVGVETVSRRTGTVSPLDIDVQKQKVQALYDDWKEAPAGGDAGNGEPKPQKGKAA